MYTSARNKRKIIDPIGYLFTYTYLGSVEDKVVKEMFLDFANELRPMINMPFRFFGTQEDEKDPYRVRIGEHLYFPDTELSGREVVLKTMEAWKADSPLLDYYSSMCKQCAIFLRVEDMPDAPDIFPGDPYEKEMKFQKKFLNNREHRMHKEKFQEMLYKCILNPDPELKHVRAVFPRSQNDFACLRFWSWPVLHEVRYIEENQRTDEERRYVEEGLFNHTFYMNVPRFFLPDGRLPEAIQRRWKEKLVEACERHPLSCGSLRMDSMLNQHIYMTPNEIFYDHYSTRARTDYLPGAAWGLALSKKQAEMICRERIFEKSNPLYIQEPMKNGGVYLQVTEDINYCPIEPLLELQKLFYPYQQHGTMKSVDPGIDALSTFRLPIDIAGIDGWFGEDGFGDIVSCWISV